MYFVTAFKEVLLMRYILQILFFLLTMNWANAQDTVIRKIHVEQDTISFDSLASSTAGYVNDTILYEEPEVTRVRIRGNIYSAMIIDGDTVILADLEDISITSPRKFASDKDYRKYLKMRRYATKVYPYAKEATRIYRELEYAHENYSKKKRKKVTERLAEELQAEFEEPLKKLTKLQGKILIKMIEKETDETMYNILKGVKGRFTAFYWHNFSKLYSYDLKEGYTEGVYEILDAVLQDFDISFEVDREEDLKYLNNLDDDKKS